eukprot:4340845-Prymnesium_polylepis.2
MAPGGAPAHMERPCALQLHGRATRHVAIAPGGVTARAPDETLTGGERDAPSRELRGAPSRRVHESSA